MNHKVAKIKAREIAIYAADEILDNLQDLDLPTTDAIVWFEPLLSHLIYLFLISQESPPRRPTKNLRFTPDLSPSTTTSR